MADGCTTTLDAGPAGLPMLVKVAAPDGRTTLRREADRLALARHPGVVNLVSASEDRLEIEWAGPQTLETLRPNLATAAGLLVAVATTVADLHGIGLVHGRIEPCHVVVDPNGCPRLCGMRGEDPDGPVPTMPDDVAGLGNLIHHLVAGEAEAEPIPERRWGRNRWLGYQRRALQTLADQATDPDPDPRPTARGLAQAIADAVPEARLVPMTSTHPEPRGGNEPEPASDLDSTIDPEHATGPEARMAEPDAEIVADAEVELMEPGATRGRAAPSASTFLGMRIEGPPEQRRRTSIDPGTTDPPGDTVTPISGAGAGPRPRRLGLSALAACVVLLVGFQFSFGPPHNPTSTESDLRSIEPVLDPRASTSATGSPAASKATTTTVLNVSSTAVADSAEPATVAVNPVCPPVAPPGADVDGDGCDDAVGVEGTTIRVDGTTYTAGVLGDRVAVGDWDCDGTATPGVLRPSTGEVFLFESWSTEEDVTAAPAAVVADAAELVTPGVPCDHPRVRLRDGSTSVLDLPTDRSRIANSGHP